MRSTLFLDKREWEENSTRSSDALDEDKSLFAICEKYVKVFQP